ncbi:MAG: anaerobic ribonucleoside-triphosphate reductase activating protein [Hungatella sp.]
MKICGLQKTTLLDYPGHVAATIFLGGCNFRCPFCHNKDLLGQDAEAFCSTEELLTFLQKRAPILEGVCITGGEPTLVPEELEALIRAIRSYGYLIKLDTNGYRPAVLKHLCEAQLLDYVAMDIKTCRERYPLVAGVPGLHIDPIEESVTYLMQGSIPYEFRTTVVKELHVADDFVKIGAWLHGCSAYFLQNYVESDQVLCPGFSAYSAKELLAFLDLLKPDIAQVGLRGIDY